MRTKIFLGLIFPAAIAVCANERIQVPNVRLGLWEMTLVTKSSGPPPYPPEMLSRLSPEQRAKMEENWRGTHTKHYKSCLTKEKLERAEGFTEEKPRCTPVIVSSSVNKMTIRRQCTEQGATSESTVELVAISPENVEGSAHSSAASGNRTWSFDATYAGKWVGPACGDVK